ncbi:hypothetical protein EON73_01160 [bacterium]|nr:MAG: hypothetical protein EON73_01160 [bacterium]
MTDGFITSISSFSLVLFLLGVFFIYSVSALWVLRMLTLTLAVATFIVSQSGNWSGFSGFWLVSFICLSSVSGWWLLFSFLFFFLLSIVVNLKFIDKFHLSGSFFQEPNFYELTFQNYLSSDFVCLIFFLLWCSFLSLFHQTKNNFLLSFSSEQIILTFVMVFAGLLTMVTDHLLILYVNLELQALTLYTLVGYFRREDERVDSALRYLLLGSFVSGFTLLSFIHLYAESGSFIVSDYRLGLDSTGTIWLLGVVFFKLGLVPFHFWSPSVYTSLDWFTLFLVIGPAKVNLWYLTFIFFRVLFNPFSVYLLIAGVLSILVGTIGGLFQKTVSTLLAYSSILNGGYLLLLSFEASYSSIAEFTFIFYLWLYLLGTAGLIIILSVYGSSNIIVYSFWNRLTLFVPLLSYYLVLNISGLPVFPGFFSKLFLVYSFFSYGIGFSFFLILFSIPASLFYLFIAAQGLFFFKDEPVIFFKKDYLIGNRRTWHPHQKETVLGFRAHKIITRIDYQLLFLRRSFQLIFSLFQRGAFIWTFNLSSSNFITEWGNCFNDWFSFFSLKSKN